MSTPLASPSLEVPMGPGPGAPARLTDAGISILPISPLRGVDFGVHLEHKDGEVREELEAPLDTEPSYFAEDAGDVEDGRKSNDMVKSSRNTGPARRADTELTGSGLKRASTAPASRPKAPDRSATLLRAIRRRQQPYQYRWDLMSSDSDSSSSDEDVRRAAVRPKTKRAQSKANKEEQKRWKQDEKQGHSFSRFHVGNKYFKSKGKVSKRDGRLNISINDTSNNGYLAKALAHSIKHHLDIPTRRRQGHKHRQYSANHPLARRESDAASIASAIPLEARRPRLNIVIMIIGSRGDIQPFMKIGKLLKEEHGHRVRIATHPTFREFVEKEGGLEFFSIGGNPSELMAFMVKNPGIIPTMQTIREGEVKRRRDGMAEMFDGMYRACVNATDDEKDVLNQKLLGSKAPFIADAIIANP